MTHLLFADDILLFAKTQDEMRCMTDQLTDALAESGLRLNAGKCKILCNDYKSMEAVRAAGNPADPVQHLITQAILLHFKAQ